MIAIIPNENITTADLKTLRQISSLSISEIKQAALEQTPIKSFEEFGSEWETDRVKLAQLAKTYSEATNLPYQFVLMEDSEIDEFLSPENLVSHLKQLRQIELETQRNTDLENGFIAIPDDFESYDEDWTVME